MPLIKKPKRLFEICNSYVNSFIINVIISVSVTRDDKIVDQRLGLVQDHIVKNMYPHLIDNLLQTIDPCGRLDERQLLMLLKVLMHSSMIIFNTRFKLPSSDFFYEVSIKELKRVVVLNLSMVCTDEILEVVGNNCPLLQVIHIVSKIGSVTNKTKRQLNALKLKFFVSDRGLECLHKCKYLRRIIMNKVTRSNCGGRKITHDGIRKLLCALPLLQFISYNDMGLVLEEGIDKCRKFNLLHLHDSHITPNHIDLFFNHCCNLKGLCLMLPTTSMDSSTPEKCLSKLTDSKLKLSSLTLGLFPLEQAFINYLSVKGQYLRSLCLFDYLTITVRTVFLIGEYCPIIEYLEITFVLPEDDDEDLFKLIGKKKLFTNLKCLKLYGSNWDPHIIYPMCINDAPNLTHLVLINKNYFKYIDAVLLNTLKNNPLIKLTLISVLDGFCVTIKTLISFVLSIPNLKSITVTKGSGYIDHLEKMKSEHNFGLNVMSDFVIDNYNSYGNCFCSYWQAGE